MAVIAFAYLREIFANYLAISFCGRLTSLVGVHTSRSFGQFDKLVKCAPRFAKMRRLAKVAKRAQRKHTNGTNKMNWLS